MRQFIRPHLLRLPDSNDGDRVAGLCATVVENITRCLASAVRLKLLNLWHPFFMVTIACTLVGSTQAQRADLEIQSASDSL